MVGDVFEQSRGIEKSQTVCDKLIWGEILTVGPVLDRSIEGESADIGGDEAKGDKVDRVGKLDYQLLREQSCREGR